MTKKSIVIGASAIAFFVMCAFATLALLQDSEEIDNFEDIDYEQAMIDIFNQYGYEVQSSGTRSYTVFIDEHSKILIGFDRGGANIGQSGQIPNMDYLYQSFNIDLWSDLLYLLSGGQISRCEVESFLSDDYELLPWYEIEFGWPYEFVSREGTEMEKVKVERLYGMQYHLRIYSDESAIESLYVEIFHLGGL